MKFSGFSEGEDVPPIMEMTAEQRLYYWPKLVKNSFRKTSHFSIDYNCVSWAVGIVSKRIDSGGQSYEWPNDLPRDHTINSYVKLYQKYGFEKCDNGNLESSLEKIALFEDEYGFFKHVALQLSSGLWTSKMGDLEDIEHKTSDAVDGWFYGKVSIYMSRQIKRKDSN